MYPNRHDKSDFCICLNTDKLINTLKISISKLVFLLISVVRNNVGSLYSYSYIE